MEAKYGTKIGRVRTSFAYSMPLFYPCIAFLFIGLAVIPATQLEGKEKVMFVFVGISALMIAYAFMQIFVCHVGVYDDAIIIRTLFKKRVIPRSEIVAIYWDRPGATEINSRGVRKNTEIAQLMLRGGKKYNITSGVYKDLTRIGEFQAKNKIPTEL